MTQSKSFFPKSIIYLFSILLASICWYFSFDLSGKYGHLLWIAPLPILILAFRVPWQQAFLAAFIAYGLGRMSWFFYLVEVATLVPAILITLIQSLIFALILVLTRRIVLQTQAWYSFFAFPALVTLSEFGVMRFSADGTVSSLAYSLSNFLPLVQLASFAGILGITFMLCLVPSILALAYFFGAKKTAFRSTLFLGLGITLGVLGWGTFRLKSLNISKGHLNVACVVLSEEHHDFSKTPDFFKDTLTTNLYLEEISKLSTKGTKLVVLPERAININKNTEGIIIDKLKKVAKQYEIRIVLGYTNFRREPTYNSAMVINEQGEIAADYHKVHLVTGLESWLGKGESIGLINQPRTNYGVSICKDLDFPEFIRQYGQNKTRFLTIPAWDFEVDAWMHSRMTVLRGVENGFATVRAARQGYLTISDRFGRILVESSASQGQKALIMGSIATDYKPTIYTRYGDWFGWGNLFLVLLLLFLIGVKKKQSSKA